MSVHCLGCLEWRTFEARWSCCWTTDVLFTQTLQILHHLICIAKHSRLHVPRLPLGSLHARVCVRWCQCCTTCQKFMMWVLLISGNLTSLVLTWLCGASCIITHSLVCPLWLLNGIVWKQCEILYALIRWVAYDALGGRWSFRSYQSYTTVKSLRRKRLFKYESCIFCENEWWRHAVSITTHTHTLKHLWCSCYFLPI